MSTYSTIETERTEQADEPQVRGRRGRLFEMKGWITRVGLAAVLAAGLAGAQQAKAAFPGANGKIAFGEGVSIFVVNPDGTGRTRLSPTPTGSVHVQYGYPAYSADGTKLAFWRIQWTPAGDVVVAATGIFVMSAASASTAGATKIPNSDNVSDPNWSPDGTKLAVIGSNGVYGDGGILTVDAATGVQTQLTSDGVDQDPTWSPDGTKIAYSALRPVSVHCPVAARTSTTFGPSTP